MLRGPTLLRLSDPRDHEALALTTD